MNVTNRIAPAALLAAAFLVPSAARAQSNAGQFGGSAPGQFDPNAQPGAQPGTVPPGQFDPNAQPGQPGTARPGQFDPNAQPGVQPGTQPGTTTPGQFDPNAQYGGGAPPPAGPNDPNDPGASLDAAKEKDSGRGLTWFWLEAGGGFEHLGLQTIDDGERSGGGSSDCVQTVTGPACPTNSPNADLSHTGTGGMIEMGVGARIVFFTIGARGRLSLLDSFKMMRVGPELGLRIPIGSIEPRISLGGGYATMFDNPTTGYYVRVSGGLDYFVSTNFAIGADLSGDLVGSDGDDADSDGDQVRQNASAGNDEITFNGTNGIGLGIGLGLHVGLHL